MYNNEKSKIVNLTFNEVSDVTLSGTSNLNMFKILEEYSGEKYLNIWRCYSIKNKDLLYTTYIVSNNEWWDSISYKVYGTETLWWVIALYNGIVNPFEELYEGRKLHILNKTHLYELLKIIKMQGNW